MKNEPINKELLRKPSNLAKEMKVSRQYIYEMIDKNKIDSTTIDGVVFVVLSDRTKNFLKS
jgi:hypothetical protein